jgi:hypothetical protein
VCVFGCASRAIYCCFIYGYTSTREKYFLIGQPRCTSADETSRITRVPKTFKKGHNLLTTQQTKHGTPAMMNPANKREKSSATRTPRQLHSVGVGGGSRRNRRYAISLAARAFPKAILPRMHQEAFLSSYHGRPAISDFSNRAPRAGLIVLPLICRDGTLTAEPTSRPLMLA